MSITIRLAKFGRKKAHSFRIVVANTKDKRNGMFLDILGFYNPSEKPVKFAYDKNKYFEWKSKGALISESVEKLIDGTYVQKSYDPHGKIHKSKKTSSN